MINYIYIKNDVNGFYMYLNEPLDEISYAGQIGSTFQDFLDGKWVLLSNQQIEFKNNNPEASVEEVFNMELNNSEEIIPERTVQRAKEEKLQQLIEYDDSTEVNSFTINNIITDWFTPAERANYKNSVDSAKTLGVGTLRIPIDNQLVYINTIKASQMLAAIQLYADQCFLVTQNHMQNINRLETIEQIDNYDFTVGYPNKLNFNLSDTQQEESEESDEREEEEE